jgi:hypothetical protein
MILEVPCIRLTPLPCRGVNQIGLPLAVSIFMSLLGDEQGLMKV